MDEMRDHDKIEYCSGNFIERMELEVAELQERLRRLVCFIGPGPFDELPKRDRQLLREQEYAMRTYWVILTERLERAKDMPPSSGAEQQQQVA